MKRNNLYIWAATFGMGVAIGLLMVANGVIAASLSGVAFGLLLIVFSLLVPLAGFVMTVAKRLDVLAETGKDWDIRMTGAHPVIRENDATAVGA